MCFINFILQRELQKTRLSGILDQLHSAAPKKSPNSSFDMTYLLKNKWTVSQLCPNESLPDVPWFTLSMNCNHLIGLKEYANSLVLLFVAFSVQLWPSLIGHLWVATITMTMWQLWRVTVTTWWDWIYHRILWWGAEVSWGYDTCF